MQEKDEQGKGEIDPYLRTLQINQYGFGHRVKDLMKSRRLTTEKLASQIEGVSAEQLKYMIQGHQQVEESVLRGLCGALDTDSIGLLPSEIVSELVRERLGQDQAPITIIITDEGLLWDSDALRREFLRVID